MFEIKTETRTVVSEKWQINDIRISRIYGNEVRSGQQVVELEVVEMR